MFTQTLLAVVQSWTRTLPVGTNSAQLLDKMTGILVFIGMSLNDMCTQHALPNSLGTGASNSLINFWHNVRDGLLTQTQLVQSLVDQGHITHSELAALRNGIIHAFALTFPPQPSIQNMATVLKIILGTLSACHLQKDVRHQWALLFLLVFVINPTTPCNITDLDALYCFLFNNGFKPTKVSSIDDPTVVRLLPGQTSIPSNPCASMRLSDCVPCKPNICDHDISWLSNHTPGIQQKVYQKTKRDESCIFPKATYLVLSSLAKDAKTVVQDPECNLNWSELRCILKKMLVVAMFTGQNESQRMCGDTNDNGGKKIW